MAHEKMEVIELYNLVRSYTDRLVCDDCKNRMKFVSINEYVYVWVTVTVRCVTCDMDLTFKLQVQDY